MKHSPFKPKKPPIPAFAYVLEADEGERHLDVFRWEDRLVAHEEASGLWWGSLDSLDHRDGREFWHECVINQRIARLFSMEQGAISKPNGATLFVGLGGTRWMDFLVAHDNSGAVRFQGETLWQPFEPSELQGVRPLAHRPTIWSPCFNTRFGWRAVRSRYEAEALAHLPSPLLSLWSHGSAAPPLRLVAIALALGWTETFHGNLNSRPLTLMLPRFWKLVLASRYERARASKPSQEWQQHLQMLLQSPEVTLPGDLKLVGGYRTPPNRMSGILWWPNPKAKIAVRFELRGVGASAHEQLEAGSELRGWLGQFFSSEEVELLFASSL